MSYKNYSLMYDRRDLPNSHYEKFTLTGEIKCIDDEIPFDLPKDWEWCRIKDISRSYIGLTYKPEDISSTGTIVLRSSNIREGKIVLEDVVKVSKSIPNNLLVEPNDIIICARNGSKKLVGKSALVTEISETTTFGAFMAICKTPLYQYVYCFLQSELFFSQLSDVSGTTTINQLTQNDFNQFLVPIPPLVEQERIIAKIEELMPLVERYGKAQSELEALNNNIREQLKKSVLQYAIEGKLVPQYEEDGTAEDLLQEIQAEKQRLYAEGKLKKKDLAHSTIFRGEDNKYYEQIDGTAVPIESDYDFPNSWDVVRLSKICRLIDGEKNEGRFVCLDAKYLRGKSSGDYLIKGKFVTKGDNIILVDGENSGEVFAVPHDGYMGSTFKQLWVSEAMHLPYVLYFIQFYKDLLRKSKKGAAIPHLNKEIFYSLLIGIPPYQEQIRIAHNIDIIAKKIKG